MSCYCDEDDYYEPEPPKKIKDCPGWVIARMQRMFEPEYGKWECGEVRKSILGMKQQLCWREMFRSGKRDGIEFKLTSPTMLFTMPSDLYAS